MENFETYKLDQTGQQTQAILDQVATNTADIEQLRALYEALTQSEPVIIQPSDTWPVADPQENVIYRVIDRVNTPPQSYSDYMWNGTAMALMATYNNSIDNEPTPGSNNFVKSGGVAASVVFDISAYHATGSTLATYSNLAAALGADGANVPASVRKGGMSVKFVQSSDNKYVQYRLMSDTFNTTVTNWQGVDEVPTNGSNNLVKSGGVAEKFNSISEDVYNNSENATATIGLDGQYVDYQSGRRSSYNPYAISLPVSLQKGDEVGVTCGANDVIAVIAKVLGTNTYESLVQGGVNDNPRLYTWVADEDCQVVFSYLKARGASYYIKWFNYKRELSNIESTLEGNTNSIGIINNSLKNKKNVVFVGDAISNTSLSDSVKSKILNSIKRISIFGFGKKEKLIVSKMKYISSYSPYTIQVTISQISNNSLQEVCYFNYGFSNPEGLVTIKPTNVSHVDCYNAEITIDTNALGTTLFNAQNVTTVEPDTFDKYGLSSDCLFDKDVVSAINPTAPKRITHAIRSVVVSNLDTTRNYKLKTLSYNRTTGLLSVGFCTDENLEIIGMLFQQTIIPEDAVGIKTIRNRDTRLIVDFNILNSVFAYSLNASTIANAHDATLIPGTPCTSLSAGEEMTLTYDGQPMRLLDCGKLTGKFYLNCGRKIFTTEHIVKQAYVANDAALTLMYEYPDTVTRDQTVYERFEYVNGIKELNTGKVLVNVAIQTANNADFEDLNRGGQSALDIFSKYYMWDGTNMTYLFEGGYRGAKYTTGIEGWVKRGGFCNMVWDFYEWENYIFVSERNGQGYGGKAWMSNDYGTTWYLIFNAYPDMNWIYKNPPYPFRNPSGFDPEHGDFDRQVGGRPDFHIHGIAYDHWRNQVIIVSGDATWVQGSYTAVWVWKNPQNITLWPEQTYEGGYSGTEVYPIGGTKANNPVKMLNNTWVRVGLHADDTGLPGNAQFVSCIPFKDVLAFTTDNNMPGGNGIIINIYPDNIVSSNFKIDYPLSPDIEGDTLTHCGGGSLMLSNLCLTTIHRENNNGMIEGSDRKAAVLVSTDGRSWKRVYVDDTLDAERNTLIAWGATMIGKPDELYLRYKGYKPEDNKIRQMRLY